MEVDVSSIKHSVGASLKAELREKWPDFSWGGEEIRFSAPVSVQVKLTNTGDLLVADGTVKTTLILTCSRCLEPFAYSLDVPFVVGYREKGKCRSEEPENDDLEVKGFSGDCIDISEDVRETLLLALPMKALCHEDCQGLCQHCGKNLNEGPCTCRTEEVDPRLAVLRDLLKEQK